MDAKLITLAINSNTDNSNNNVVGEVEGKQVKLDDLSVIELALVGGGDGAAYLY
jgi:hypothetical protein